MLCKFTDHLKGSNVDQFRESDIARRCLTGSITLQCGLSAGKQSSMQVTKRTWHMCEQCVPDFFPAQGPGNKASSNTAAAVPPGTAIATAF